VKVDPEVCVGTEWGKQSMDQVLIGPQQPF